MRDSLARWTLADRLWWRAIIAFACLCAAGCSVPREQSSTIEQQQRESIAAVTTTDVVRSTEVTPPDVTITTKADDGTVVEIKQPSHQHETIEASTTASENSDAEASGSRTWISTIPLSVALLIGGVGLIVIAVGLWLLTKWFKSTVIGKATTQAANAAWSGSAEMVGGLVHTIRTMQTTEKNQDVITALKSVEAEGQRLVGEMHKD